MSALSDFGAVGDARQVHPIAMVADSPLAVAAPGTFTAADVGKNIVVAGAGASGAKLSTTIAEFVDETTVSLAQAAATTQAETGASLGTDCSGALQAALDSLADNGGGELFIEGEYLLTAPVYKNFQALASSVRLRGAGSASALLIACGATDAAITLGNLIRLRIEGIDFVGTPHERNDARIVLDLQTCLSADLEGNSFYGFANVDSPEAAVVNNQSGGLNLLRNGFGGCMIANGGVVLNNLWQHFSSEGNRFIDFGQRNGILHSKTFLLTGQSWIRIGDPVAAAAYESNPALAYPHASVRLEGDFYDEGTKNPVLINSPAKRIGGVRIAGCRFNVNGFTTGTTGPAILNVADLSIEHCSIGYCNAPRFAIYLNTVRHARIVGVVTNGVVTTLKAYTIDWLEIVNSPTLSNLELTAVTRQTINGLAP
ncbi:MAG TPA: hypothetical protein VF535_01220 [Allosphingosinicella sp.]|jgi:hypothetical protein